MRFRYVRDAAGTVVVAGKKDGEDKLVPVGVGDFVDIDEKNEHNKDMIDSGALIPAAKNSEGGEK